MATTAAIGVPARSGRKGKAESNARDAELQNIHRAFAVIDKDHSGEVDRSEVRPEHIPALLSLEVLTDRLARPAGGALLGAWPPNDV